LNKIIKSAGSLMLGAVLLFNLPFSTDRVSAAVSGEREKELRQELATLVNTVKENYYEKVDTEKMLKEVFEESDDKIDIDNISKKFVSKLNDPYSVYYTAKELASFNSAMKGEYYGIGVEIAKDKKTGGIRINKVFAGSPAEKAKLKRGDIILKAGDTDLTKLELSEATTFVKGEKGTKIILTILRGKTEKKIEVERNEVIIPSVSYKTYEKGKVGYIRVSGFLEKTDEEFAGALDKLEAKGIEGLIIDLRDNGGGFVDTAYNMLNRILPSDKEAFSFGYGNGKKEYFVTSNNPDEKDKTFCLPVLILINKNSASASEIFTGALVDYGYAETVGETSYGKGVAQSVYQMQNLFTGAVTGGVKLTTIKYYLPEGESINKVGIEPDYKVVDNKKTAKDEQLEKAFKEIKKMIN